MPVVRQFDISFNDLIEAQDVRRGDLITIMWSCLSRLRVELTHEVCHQLVHGMMVAVEQRIQAGTGFLNPRTLEPVNQMLAEEREATGQEAYETPDFVPEDWLSE